MKALFPGAVLVAALFLAPAPICAQTDTDGAIYHAPEGTAPPVAPPIRKGSPLDHLANDPKLPLPVPGYREGNTTGATYYIGHRFVDPDGGMGWGWLRRSDQAWGNAQWIALQETPGLAVAPYRKLLKHEADNDWEYKFWGKLVAYKAYDPHLDEQLPIFVLQGYEVVGPAQPLALHYGAPGRPQSRGSGASSRTSQPVRSNPGVD